MMTISVCGRERRRIHACVLFPLAIAHPPDDDNKCVWEGEEEDKCMCAFSARDSTSRICVPTII